MSRFLTLSFVFAALTLAASYAPAAETLTTTPSRQAILGTWMTGFTDNQGNQGYLVVVLNSDGTSEVVICNDQKVELKSARGTFSYENGILTVTVNGQVFGKEHVLAVNDDEMVTSDGKSQTTWHRAHVVNS